MYTSFLQIRQISSIAQKKIEINMGGRYYCDNELREQYVRMVGLGIEYNLNITAMKTSSSNRDRTATATQSRVPKPPKPTTPLEVTNFNVGVVGRKSDANRGMPVKAPSKSEFNVEVNMTESKIFQAKQGLTLLKRKMNRTGMSRQKNYSNSEKTEENRVPSSTSHSKQQLPQKNNQQKRTVPVSKNENANEYVGSGNMRQGTVSTVKAAKERVNVEVVNEYLDERPIAKNTDFMDLLQREMKKEQSLKVKPIPSQQANKQSVQAKNKIIDDNGVEVILETCSRGCGRMFHPDTLGKHEKVCEKVFQSKRKAFNSAMHRQVQAEYQPKPVVKQEVKPKKKNEIPKWKLESAAFRAGLKQGKNQTLTKQQEKMLQITQDTLKMCQFCGRKFNEQASKKHVPFCEKKSKELSKARTSKKK